MLGVAAMAVQNALGRILVGAPPTTAMNDRRHDLHDDVGALLKVEIGPWSLALPTERIAPPEQEFLARKDAKIPTRHPGLF